MLTNRQARCTKDEGCTCSSATICPTQYSGLSLSTAADLSSSLWLPSTPANKSAGISCSVSSPSVSCRLSYSLISLQNDAQCLGTAQPQLSPFQVSHSKHGHCSTGRQQGRWWWCQCLLSTAQNVNDTQLKSANAWQCMA